ncbi:MAG: helix-turn-helix domain-containing protein [Archangium sp.]
MARLKAAPARGLIKSRAAVAFRHEHHRYEVDAPLNRSIEHWWSVAWSLPKGQTHAQSSLPHPSIHVVWEGDAVEVVGVVTGRYTRVLEGESRAFAAKFRPGAFHGVLGSSVSALTDRIVSLGEVVGAKRARRYRDALRAARDDHARVVVATEFFSALVPEPSADAELLAGLVQAATVDRTVTTVEALRERAGMHLRELQRWFREAVGISPKWMIQRYRLHEALLALEKKGRDVPLAQLAAELGYVDQSHFARDFRALVGVAPSAYARQ